MSGMVDRIRQSISPVLRTKRSLIKWGLFCLLAVIGSIAGGTYLLIESATERHAQVFDVESESPLSTRAERYEEEREKERVLEKVNEKMNEVGGGGLGVVASTLGIGAGVVGLGSGGTYLTCRLSGKLCDLSPAHQVLKEDTSKAPIPILVMHGMASGEHAMKELKEFIQKKYPNRPVHTLAGAENLATIASHIRDQVILMARELHVSETTPLARDIIAAGEKFDLIGHSLGGVVSRAYIQAYNHHPQFFHVRRFISFNSPQTGVHRDSKTFIDYIKKNVDLKDAIKTVSNDLCSTFTNSVLGEKKQGGSLWNPGNWLPNIKKGAMSALTRIVNSNIAQDFALSGCELAAEKVVEIVDANNRGATAAFIPPAFDDIRENSRFFHSLNYPGTNVHVHRNNVLSIEKWVLIKSIPDMIIHPFCSAWMQVTDDTSDKADVVGHEAKWFTDLGFKQLQQGQNLIRFEHDADHMVDRVIADGKAVKVLNAALDILDG